MAAEFPNAKFIHITRDPRALFPSTYRLWKGLDAVQALQLPEHDDLADYVIECFSRMYAAHHRQRQSVDPQRVIDIRYEDLIGDPVGTLRRIYETLRLSDFDSAEPAIRQWVENEHRSYQTNKHSLSPEQEALIQDAWQDYFQRYGYE